MMHPINNGTTTGSYKPPAMRCTRPGADAHLSIASLTTGVMPVKTEPVIVAAPVTARPRVTAQADLLPIKTKEPKVAITKQIPAKAAKAAAKPKRAEDDYSTPYKPQAVPAPVLTLPPALPVEKPARKERKAAQWVDLSALEVCDSPLSVARARPVSKYEDVLRRMKPGQCIKCQPAEVGPVASSLRSFFSRNGIVAKIRTTLRYQTDGLGRVWWVQAGGVQ